ncbi:hypothetical protein IMZ29_03805 [Achromobacter sp. GG226]|uniref:hypothetical protein n=1 Tax=Verticiella alkaliphila TaxID=2779529 RepID=UPI001C0E4D94|nr:hypothetical protein [Verticiella sp. GG226]MBU4609704.1 hypothetical protein [Verticiella sp. GG226]
MSTSKSDNAAYANLRLNSRVLALEVGMYIVRYASELPAGEEVAITLQQAPLGKGSVDLFPAEGVARNTLSKLGDCVIIRVKGDTGALLVTEYHMAGQRPREVNLRVDRIDTSENLLKRAPAEPPRVLVDSASPAVPAPVIAPAAVRTSPLQKAEPPRLPPELAPAAAVPLSLEGHIERRGDVSVDSGWLGNPQGNARLEGFTIHWPGKPEGVDLAYSVRVQGQGKQPAALSGRFAGTRQKAAGITAITFGLVGPKQKQFQLDGQVVFSGAPPQTILNGHEIASPTGLDPLVAISLAIVPKSEANAPRYQSPWEDPAITKIYKAQG